jgi:hypothetical protein
MADAPFVANASGVVIGPDGKRLFGMDAELFLKREGTVDPNLHTSATLTQTQRNVM